MDEKKPKKRGRPPKSGKKPPTDRAEGLTKRNRGNLISKQAGTALDINPTGGINTAITSHLREIMEIGANSDTKDPGNLMRCFEAYLNLCIKNDQRPGNLQAYMAMGINRKTANSWKTGHRHGNDPRYRELIDVVDMVCGSYREALAVNGSIPPAIAIFWAKNYDGMCDTPPMLLENADPLGEHQSADEIAAKYADIIED